MISMPMRIRRARVQAGLTQSELARRLGVQRSAVTQWERDNGTVPSVVHLAQLASETQVCFEWIATGRGPSKPELDAFSTALTDQDFARDEIESRALLALRRVSGRKREPLVLILEMFSS